MFDSLYATGPAAEGAEGAPGERPPPGAGFHDPSQSRTRREADEKARSESPRDRRVKGVCDMDSGSVTNVLAINLCQCL